MSSPWKNSALIMIVFCRIRFVSPSCSRHGHHHSVPFSRCSCRQHRQGAAPLPLPRWKSSLWKPLVPVVGAKTRGRGNYVQYLLPGFGPGAGEHGVIDWVAPTPRCPGRRLRVVQCAADANPWYGANAPYRICGSASARVSAWACLIRLINHAAPTAWTSSKTKRRTTRLRVALRWGPVETTAAKTTWS